MKRSAAELASLSRLLDQALELPAEERATWIDRLDAANQALKPQPRIWLVHSAVLRQSGDAAAARAWAGKAWEASRIYDVESADSIRLAAAARR